jgi:hypothetical protein
VRYYVAYFPKLRFAAYACRSGLLLFHRGANDDPELLREKVKFVANAQTQT